MSPTCTLILCVYVKSLNPSVSTSPHPESTDNCTHGTGGPGTCCDSWVSPGCHQPCAPGQSCQRHPPRPRPSLWDTGRWRTRPLPAQGTRAGDPVALAQPAAWHELPPCRGQRDAQPSSTVLALGELRTQPSLRVLPGTWVAGEAGAGTAAAAGARGSAGAVQRDLPACTGENHLKIHLASSSLIPFHHRARLLVLRHTWLCRADLLGQAGHGGLGHWGQSLPPSTSLCCSGPMATAPSPDVVQCATLPVLPAALPREASHQRTRCCELALNTATRL